MKIALSSLLVLLLNCAVLDAQVLTDSIRIDNNYRTFRFNKPVASAQASLIFVMHGSGGSGKNMMQNTTKLESLSKTENFIVVYPDGYKRYWNECRKTANSEANRLNIDETAFFNAMIGYFKKKYNVNEHQVFAVGTSGGGHMAYKLAVTMPEKFKAITAIIANLPETDNMDCAEANVAVPVMIINGTADTTNPYQGGEVITGNISMGFVRSTDNTFSYWSGLAGYKGEPVKTTVPDKDPGDGKTIERFTFQQKGKPEVTLLKVIGGKHDYPNDLDVHVEAWAFFKRQIAK
jgi:polyhydroxybutyrate depolymerase